MGLAYTNNDEFNKIFKKYNITEEEYSQIITNDLLFDMGQIYMRYNLMKMQGNRWYRIIVNFIVRILGEQRASEICVKNVLKALFTQHGITDCLDMCRELLNNSILEIEDYYEVINIQEVINLLEVQLDRVKQRSKTYENNN